MDRQTSIFIVTIIKEDDKLTLENPGYIRLGKEQMRRGGKSDPRNKSLMKMFNLIDIGEHSGSGVPIFLMYGRMRDRKNL